MATVFHVPCHTAGKRWHAGFRAETGTQTTTGRVFPDFQISFQDQPNVTSNVAHPCILLNTEDTLINHI